MLVDNSCEQPCLSLCWGQQTACRDKASPGLSYILEEERGIEEPKAGSIPPSGEEGRENQALCL